MKNPDFTVLEQAFNTELAGEPGTLDQEKDRTGAWIFGTRRNYKPAINGDNLILTIDKSIQLKSEEVVKKAVEKNAADSGSVIIMDPKSGAVLAMGKFPIVRSQQFFKSERCEFV